MQDTRQVRRLNLFKPCSNNKAQQSRSQDPAAGSEPQDKASAPLHGCGKVTEHFVCPFPILEAGMFIFYLIHSVVLVTARLLLGDSRPAPRQQGQATRYCSYEAMSRISAVASKIPAVHPIPPYLPHEPDRLRTPGTPGSRASPAAGEMLLACLVSWLSCAEREKRS